MSLALPLVVALVAAVGGAKPVKRPAAPTPVACPEPPPVPPAPVRSEPEVVRVMLPDLDVAPRHAAARDALGQIVAEEAGRVHGYQLLSAAEVRAVVDQEANKQLAGCDETSCLAELAEALDAELVVSGRISETPDGASLVSLTLVNARAIVVVNRVNVVWRGPENRLPDVVRTSAQRLLLPGKQRAPGAVVVTGVPDGARVLVDGVERTNDHRGGRIGGLDVGVHEVNIEAVDKLPLTIPVVVLSGVDSVVEGAMEDVPVAAVWLWAGGIGAVVAGAAMTGTVLYFSGRGDVDIKAAVPASDVNAVESLRGIGK